MVGLSLACNCATEASSFTVLARFCASCALSDCACAVTTTLLPNFTHAAADWIVWSALLPPEAPSPGIVGTPAFGCSELGGTVVITQASSWPLHWLTSVRTAAGRRTASSDGRERL